MGGMMRLAAGYGGRITLFLNQPEADEWEPDGQLRLCEATAESEVVHSAIKVKVKSRGKKVGKFSCFVFSLHSRLTWSSCKWEGLWGQWKNRNPHSARGAGRF